MTIEQISKAHIELHVRPLVAVDLALETLAKLGQEQRSQEISEGLSLFYSAALASKGVDLTALRKVEEAFFDRGLDHQTQRFISICLLRLLDCSAYCFEDRRFRIKVFEMFDRVFCNDLYKILHIKETDQTYEKQSKLEGIVSEVESELSQYLETIHSLKVLSGFKHGFMQRLNKQPSVAVITPFIPRELLGARLDALFTGIDEYLTDRNSTKSVQLFQEAKSTLDSYASEAKAFGTKYSREYLEGLAERLSSLLTVDFEENPVSRPAQLQVEKMEKKYPLHASAEELLISFIIRNEGPGYSFDTSLRIIDAGNITFNVLDRYLGHLKPGYMVMELPGSVTYANESPRFSVALDWANYDGSTAHVESTLQLEGQRADIDWDILTKEDPYSLDPVTSESDFVGRSEILSRLAARVQGKKIGSCYVHGQKRVGKTSIVKMLANKLKSEHLGNYNVVYVDVGDYIYPDAPATVANLGRMLCEAVRIADTRLRDLPLPSFTNAITPLAEFLKAAHSIVPDLRVLFILDEFDELPTELYLPGPLGDTFFLTLRSISGKEPFGFLLVGGEKIRHIISYQGEKLNRFDVVRVDYFDKEKYWYDFQSLVRKPVEKWFEVSDDALAVLYDETSGHPYFTKLICGHLFKLMVARRDCHVTRKEVIEATKSALRETASNSFKHFWDDDIVSEQREMISVDRRKTLLALIEAIREHTVARKAAILKHSRAYNITEIAVESSLRDFVSREVLILTDDRYETKVRFFGEWLPERGIAEIIATLPYLDPVLTKKKEEEELTISAKEVVDLSEKWGEYRGRTITEDRIRAWLAQFGSLENQRLMFHLLQGITFYKGDAIRSKMKEAYGIVVRGLVHRIESRRKRRDILVSYLDQIGKSGSQYAKLFAEENEIYYENVVERGKLSAVLTSGKSIQAVVFVDDFVGTGNAACEYFEKLAADCGQVLRSRDIKAYFVVLCGFQTAISKVEERLQQLELPITIHVCDPLDDSAHCFSEASYVFTDVIARQKAKDIASTFGLRLQQSMPLGYGNCEAVVVFADSCPNDSLPILWDRSSNWAPLFERL